MARTDPFKDPVRIAEAAAIFRTALARKAERETTHAAVARTGQDGVTAYDWYDLEAGAS